MTDDIDTEIERLVLEGDHTPTPWGIAEFGRGNPNVVTAQYSPGAAWGTGNRLAWFDAGDPDCERSVAMAAKNAAHAVKCVNAHEAMRKALEELLEESVELLGDLNSERMEDGWDEIPESDCLAISRARIILDVMKEVKS